MNANKKLDFKQIFYKYGTVLILLVMCVTLSIVTPNFLTTRNLLNVVKQISIYVIIGFGVTKVIITGGIDLSSGSVVALSSMVMGTFAVKLGMHWVFAMLLSLLCGTLVGVFNGCVVAFFRLPPFVATLGTMLSLRGVALFISDKPISGFGNDFLFLGRGSFLGIPILVYFLLGVGIISFYLLGHTKFGRYVYAIGGNAEAARVSGIDNKKIIIATYAYASTLAALAGVLLTSRIMTASPSSGTGFEMDAIAGVVIGGTSLAGGVGTIWGTLVGALIIGVLNNGLDLMLVNAYAQQVLKGLIIIAAVIFDQIRNKR
mgnify:CR=1 FL=1